MQSTNQPLLLRRLGRSRHSAQRQQLIQQRQQRICPKLIARRIRVQAVRAQALPVVTHWSHHWDQVQVVNGTFVRKRPQNRVRRHHQIVGSRIRHDAHQNRLDPRIHRLSLRQDGLHPSCNLRRRIVRVVGPDQHHRHLRVQPLDWIILHPPQDVLRLVAADSKIQRIAARKVRLPHRFTLAAPTLRNRVAKKQNIDIPTVERGQLPRRKLQQVRIIEKTSHVGHCRLRCRLRQTRNRRSWYDRHSSGLWQRHRRRRHRRNRHRSCHLPHKSHR